MESGRSNSLRGSRVTVGGPTRDREPADLVLLANLSRKHATFVRSGEGYILEAHGACKVADRAVEGRTHLNTNYRLELASGVRLRFRLPSVLSATAVIDFLSDHRPNRSIDGVILMEQACLLGPDRRQPYCLSRLERDGRPLPEAGRLLVQIAVAGGHRRPMDRERRSRETRQLRQR